MTSPRSPSQRRCLWVKLSGADHCTLSAPPEGDKAGQGFRALWFRKGSKPSKSKRSLWPPATEFRSSGSDSQPLWGFTGRSDPEAEVQTSVLGAQVR